MIRNYGKLAHSLIKITPDLQVCPHTPAPPKALTIKGVYVVSKSLYLAPLEWIEYRKLTKGIN